MIVGRQQAIVRPGLLQVEALHPGRDGLGDDLLLALLAEQVGDDARHALRQAHALDLLVLHVAAQHERHHVLIEAHRRRGVNDVAPFLVRFRVRVRVRVRVQVEVRVMARVRVKVVAKPRTATAYACC